MIVNDLPTTQNPTPETIEAEEVLRLPGHLFFVENIELPPTLEENEIADFAELTVESIAPFPIDQLSWGFLHSVDSSSILIYAAHRDRLKKFGINDMDAYAWVLPDFASLQGAHFPEATEITLISTESITLLQFEGGSEIPSAVIAQPAKGEHDSHAIEAMRKELDNSAVFPRQLALRLIDTEVSEQGIPTFHHAEEGTSNGESYGHWHELKSNEKTLWQADVRSSHFKTSERSARRTGALLTKITAWAALAALFLIGLELILLAGKAWLGTQVTLIAQQQPTVARIEDEQALMNKLEQVAQNELRPIAILESLNTTRPDGIYFTSTETAGENRITLDGIASTINDLNRYVESLSQSGIFELIGSPKNITRSGKTTFTATLDYKHREVTAPLIAPTLSETPPISTSVEDADPRDPNLKSRRQLQTPNLTTIQAEEAPER